jgi:hypothetical protein
MRHVAQHRLQFTVPRLELVASGMVEWSGRRYTLSRSKLVCANPTLQDSRDVQRVVSAMVDGQTLTPPHAVLPVRLRSEFSEREG